MNSAASHWLTRFFACLLLLLAAAAPEIRADTESARYLRNALHFYEVHRYRKSREYFVALLSIGTAREQAMARDYLRRRELQDPLVWKKREIPSVSRPAIPSKNADSLLEEPEMAPERETSAVAGKESPVSLSGYLRQETAFRISDPQQLSKFRQVASMAGTGQWMEGISYKVSGRLYYDAVFDLTRHYPQSVEDDQKKEAVLRDTYLDISKGDWDIRAGKQQIVWGEAIGLFYADVVNAKDLREYVLPDFEFIRIPEWATDVEYTLGNFHAEGVWLPFPEMDKIGRPGSEFAFPIPVIPGFTVAFAPRSTPADSFDNGEVGGRLSYRAGGWDLGTFLLRTWDKEPVYARSVQPGLITFQETHPRLTTEGFTFSKELDSVVVKGEFVYNVQKEFISTDFNSPTGLVAKDYIDYLFGLDHTFSQKIDASVQFSQRIIRDYESSIYLEKQRRDIVTLSVRRPFLDERLEPSFLVIKDLSADDYLIRPKITYKWATHWRVGLGLDIFGGSQDTPFGVYKGRNRISSEVRFDF